ncbi:lipid phosphate phosphohydrolase 1 isoform X3 [Brachionus plicatilis]|uniref:Lipid phosphate phosphohydrolase 1 isoform X3 n=1 Tax=Brachionus plicatilis TaxID=10195 RepID=A0A3M7QJA4_BRAPC|nr:lipid phosphate phosphohydrolase 1 isoform X3 [Brachionus plicatilis]
MKLRNKFFSRDPKIRYFTCDMSDISFPYKSDTVKFWVVGIYGVLGPLVFIIFVELLNAKIFPFQNKNQQPFYSRLRSLGIYLFHSISLFIFGVSIVLLLTEIGKRWIGRLRPHFLDVCKPNLSQIDCVTNGLSGTIYNSISTGGNFCTGDAGDIEEARLSFPSGHASFSAYTMLFLIIYLEARLFLVRFRYIKALIQLTAFIASFVTSISRISDYHHRGSDVVGGLVLGSIIALFITLILGKILWVVDEEFYYDFDDKFLNQKN